MFSKFHKSHLQMCRGMVFQNKKLFRGIILCLRDKSNMDIVIRRFRLFICLVFLKLHFRILYIDLVWWQWNLDFSLKLSKDYHLQSEVVDPKTRTILYFFFFNFRKILILIIFQIFFKLIKSQTSFLFLILLKIFERLINSSITI